jgi:hypothetical protein
MIACASSGETVWYVRSNDNKGASKPGQPAAVSPRSNERLHNLCIFGSREARLGDAYTNCPNGRMLEQEERSVLA